MMTMRFSMISALIFSFFAMATTANATTFVFKGGGLNVTPQGDFVQDCGTVGVDFCSMPDHSNGLAYERNGVELTVRAYKDGSPTRLIQDITPDNSGLAAFSEATARDDQTQFDAGESIEFDFGMESVTVVDVEFNAGDDIDCSAAAGGGGEGSCGSFLLEIFDINDLMILSMIVDITNVDMLPVLGTGARFLLTALDAGSGFVVAQLTIADVPIPGAIPFLITGLAGLGFASRKKKSA